MVLERYCAHPERCGIQKDSVRGLPLRQDFPLETPSATKLRAPRAPVGFELVCGDHVIGLVVLHEVPGVGGELVFELGDEPPGAVQTTTGVAPYPAPQ